jgi:hypothetical protein
LEKVYHALHVQESEPCYFPPGLKFTENENDDEPHLHQVARIVLHHGRVANFHHEMSEPEVLQVYITGKPPLSRRSHWHGHAGLEGIMIFQVKTMVTILTLS